MSWSVGAKGKVADVKVKIAEQFTGMEPYPCPEPEESIKHSAMNLINQALDAQDQESNIEVSAYGSQSQDFQTKAIRNSLNVTLIPQG